MTDVATKLQVKPGMAVCVLHAPAAVPVDLVLADGCRSTDDPDAADAVVVFVADREQLGARSGPAIDAAGRGALSWVAYPKAGQLGTDLNRDSVRDLLAGRGVDTVRQVAIDDVWSALRFKAARG